MATIENQTLQHVIRSADQQDAPLIKDLLAQMGYELTESEVADRINLFNDNPLYENRVIEYDGQIVGFIAMIINDYFLRPTRFCYIDAIVIDQSFRRMGFGEILLNTIENFAREHGCAYVELHSGKHRAASGTYSFYEQLGYQVLNDETTFFKKEL